MNHILLSEKEISESVTNLFEAARVSANEEQFKIRAEGILEQLCKSRNIFWNSYSYEYSLNSGRRRVDAIHGSTIIEYEPPRSFNGIENAQLRHARKQVEEYAILLAEEEGRNLGKYSLVAWDGDTITFGYANNKTFIWENARSFDGNCLNRLLALIADGGRPLVSPMLLKQLIGPETEVGQRLLPALFSAVCKAYDSSSTTRTKLIYTEWVRLFGQVDGTETDRLTQYLEDISQLHGIEYYKNPQAYVFALNTYIAIVAKTCAVYALTSRSDVVPAITNAKSFLSTIEDSGYFKLFGIENMLGTDFFSWYLGDDVKNLNIPLGILLDRLLTIDFDITQKNPESVRDLFKGLYMGFTPAPMRHALGEYYTPDWLASHVMDVAAWRPEQSLLDPTCGSGTFILEGLRRRLEVASPNASARDLLEGLYGFDLNPLAVLTTKASIVVFLSERFDMSDPVLLPIFLADAINTADPVDDIFRHSILTEKGERTFSIPVALAKAVDFFYVMDHLRSCIDSGLEINDIMLSLCSISCTVKLLEKKHIDILKQTIQTLIELHRNHWNGIWCLILFDRIEAGCVKNVDLVAGNPPWVKWSHLPRPYAEFIKPICDRMNIFSDDTWVGGIQSDVSTVVTYHALERFVKRGGGLAFLITGTVFKNESSQGFRRWKLYTEQGEESMAVEIVEDYALLRPFEGVANWPMLLIIRRNDKCTEYPVNYRKYLKKKCKNTAPELSSYEDLFAMPVPGTDAGPWLVGTDSDMAVWPNLFNTGCESYRSRKGVTTDANGIFFVDAQTTSTNLVLIRNDPRNGRHRNIVARSVLVERDDVFPLLRGRDVQRFVAKPKIGQCIIVPQRGMFGDEALPSTRPLLFKYLCLFREILEHRSSYRRFQKGKPFWSVWSTGEYTFSPYKVVWKEMSGPTFVAAYVGSSQFGAETKVVIPDHKVYFVPMETENEAAYLTAFLNSRIIAHAISAYASNLSLGTSVTDYINIPKFDSTNTEMVRLATMAKLFKNGIVPTPLEEDELDTLVISLLQL